MLHKRLSLFGAAAIAGAMTLLTGATPVSAVSAGAGAGLVTGSVTITAPVVGVTINCAATTYRFNPIVLTGVTAAANVPNTATDDAGASVGAITTNAPVGGSAVVFATNPLTGAAVGPLPQVNNCPPGQENLIGATGTVSPVTFASVAPTVGTVAGACNGGPNGNVFDRIGPVVLVQLNDCNFRSNLGLAPLVGSRACVTPPCVTFRGTIIVAALFAPNNPADPPGTVTSAAFAGVFAGLGIQ